MVCGVGEDRRARTRVGLFLVPAGLPGTRIVETWDHLGLRASGSHDVVFEDVVFPLDHEIDVRKPEEWRVPDFTQSTVHAIFVAAIYDGIARAARDWLIDFLKNRTAIQPRRVAGNVATGAGSRRRHRGAACRQCGLIDSFAGDFDDGVLRSASESNIVKLTVTNNAVASSKTRCR